jgi:hypothetical protein
MISKMLVCSYDLGFLHDIRLATTIFDSMCWRIAYLDFLFMCCGLGANLLLLRLGYGDDTSYLFEGG